MDLFFNKTSFVKFTNYYYLIIRNHSSFLRLGISEAKNEEKKCKILKLFFVFAFLWFLFFMRLIGTMYLLGKKGGETETKDDW